MTHVVLYTDLDKVAADEQAAYLEYAAGLGFGIDDLYPRLGIAEDFLTVLSAPLTAMFRKLSDDSGLLAAAKLETLLGYLFRTGGGKRAIEDRDTRITFIWDDAAVSDTTLACAAMVTVGASLHLIADGAIFRWQPDEKRWTANRP